MLEWLGFLIDALYNFINITTILKLGLINLLLVNLINCLIITFRKVI